MSLLLKFRLKTNPVRLSLFQEKHIVKKANRKTKDSINRAKDFHKEFLRLKVRKQASVALRKARIFSFSKRRQVLLLVNSIERKKQLISNQPNRYSIKKDLSLINMEFIKELKEILGDKTKDFLKEFNKLGVEKYE
ncbi:MAG: hypothetical protein PHQ98_03850 [Candidatus ainarchaeum sp.]|nr:hypothetical protein [Candidatus ainarchaeum sp.]